MTNQTVVSKVAGCTGSVTNNQQVSREKTCCLGQNSDVRDPSNKFYLYNLKNSVHVPDVGHFEMGVNFLLLIFTKI